MAVNIGIVPAVQIGTQIWTTRNLNVTTYRNGDPIPQVTDSGAWAGLTTGAWCYYNNSSSNRYDYGKLYNWYAVNDARGLAPLGWHVPSDAEWNTMLTYLDPTVDPNANGSYTGTTIGRQLKYTSGWNNNGNGTNSSGFRAFGGGSRSSSDGTFYYITAIGSWWSSSAIDANNAWYRSQIGGFSSIYRGGENNKIGFSVRLVKD